MKKIVLSETWTWKIQYKLGIKSGVSKNQFYSFWLKPISFSHLQEWAKTQFY